MDEDVFLVLVEVFFEEGFGLVLFNAVVGEDGKECFFHDCNL